MSLAPVGLVALSVWVPLGGGGRRLALANGLATLTYTPPAGPALDLLVVALEGDGGAGDGRPGIELARFALATRPGP